MVLIKARHGTSGTQVENVQFRVNGVSTNTYSQAWFEGNSTSASTYAGTLSGLELRVSGSSTSASSFGAAKILIPRYAETSYSKKFFIESVTASQSTLQYSKYNSGDNANTSAISSVTLTTYSGTFAIGTTMSVYTITKA